MLLLELRIGALHGLESGDLARRAGGRGFAEPPAEGALPHVLPPFREHERVDLERGGDALHLEPGLMTEANGRQLELGAIAPNLSWTGTSHLTPPELGGSVYQTGARSTDSFNHLLGSSLAPSV